MKCFNTCFQDVISQFSFQKRKKQQNKIKQNADPRSNDCLQSFICNGSNFKLDL